MTDASANDVDTKTATCSRFGNDNAGVDTKPPPLAKFGNDTIGFIRVRKRVLKPHRWTGSARSSMSFDLVKAVRVDGKPRHAFVLGLGSQKRPVADRWPWFWYCAIRRMIRHGLDAEQRRRLIAEMVRKGAGLPTPKQCHDWANGWRHDTSELAEIAPFIDHNAGAAP